MQKSSPSADWSCCRIRRWSKSSSHPKLLQWKTHSNRAHPSRQSAMCCKFWRRTYWSELRRNTRCSLAVPPLHLCLPGLQPDYRPLQDEGRLPKTLTLKWRHKQDGWSRSSASCPMPTAVEVRTPALCVAPASEHACSSSIQSGGLIGQQGSQPLIDAQVRKPLDEKQATALVDAAMALFKRNNAGPFVLTLLNLGATNFAAAGPGHGMPAAFTRLLGSSKPAARPPPNTSSQAGDPSRTACTLAHDHRFRWGQGDGLAGAGRRTASKLTQARRDYGGNPSGAPVSKMQERCLREQAGVTTRSSADADDLCQGSQAFEQQPQRSVLPHSPPVQHVSSNACIAHPARSGSKGAWPPPLWRPKAHDGLAHCDSQCSTDGGLERMLHVHTRRSSPTGASVFAEDAMHSALHVLPLACAGLAARRGG